jgi:hypothetical protein
VTPHFIKKEYQLWIDFTFNDRVYKPITKMNPAGWIAEAARSRLLFYRVSASVIVLLFLQYAFIFQSLELDISVIFSVYVQVWLLCHLTFPQ